MDHFDLLAPLYDRLISPPEEDILRSFIQDPLEGKLLDVGGGTGRIAQQLADHSDGIVILDRSLRMLKEAKGKGSFNLICGSSNELPFPEGAFECILVVDAFHHFSRQEESLKDLWRIVSPGGRMIIEEPDITRFGVKLIALFEKLALFTSHFVRGESIAAQLEALGASTTLHRSSYNIQVVADKLA